MATYLTPGVYYERVDAVAPAITAIRTDVAGFRRHGAAWPARYGRARRSRGVSFRRSSEDLPATRSWPTLCAPFLKTAGSAAGWCALRPTILWAERSRRAWSSRTLRLSPEACGMYALPALGCGATNSPSPCARRIRCKPWDGSTKIIPSAWLSPARPALSGHAGTPYAAGKTAASSRSGCDRCDWRIRRRHCRTPRNLSCGYRIVPELHLPYDTTPLDFVPGSRHRRRKHRIHTPGGTAKSSTGALSRDCR